MDTIDILTRAAELRDTGTPFALATVTLSLRPTSARLGAKAIIMPDGALFGWVGGACSQPSVVRHAREAILSGEPRLVRLSPDAEGDAQRAGIIEMPMTCHSGGTVEIFIEPFLPEPYLIAAGDSPVARALLTLGKPLGFRTVAMGMAEAGADESYDGMTFDRLSPYRVPFVVVATMGVEDEDALLAALELEPPYLALVGSRRRFETVADLLRVQGADAERVAAIRVPAGLDIGAETPAEIALSILAEAVQVRRDLRLSGRLTLLGPAEDEQPASQIVIDPICGMEVDLATARHTLEVNGETLGFCCPGCLYAYRQQLAG